MSIGDKGSAGLSRPFPDCLSSAITNIQVPFNYPTVMAISEIINQESSNKDKITIYYN